MSPAACDLAVVQGGGTTTLELTVLRRPFLYFPLERHCEQQIHVAGRLARHRAGVKMSFKNTTPEILAESIADNIGKEITYDPIPVDGARNAAEKIRRFLV
jgi:UDP-N-acetylglucosamine:LPS N-acetylglucosamine transferase